jgi:WD40 repeat protein
MYSWLNPAKSAKPELRGHELGILNVAFSPDGKRIASVRIGSELSVIILDVNTGLEFLTRVPKRNPHGIDFRSMGRLVKLFASLDWDQAVKLWDQGTGQEVLNLQGHAELIINVAFSPDGKRIASAGTDHSVKIWDAETGQETLTLKGHNDRVVKVIFSPDGNLLVSASQDGTIRVWDARLLGAQPAFGRTVRAQP